MINSELYNKIVNQAVLSRKTDRKLSDFYKLIISEFDRKAYGTVDFTDKKAVEILTNMKKSAEENLKYPSTKEEAEFEISILSPLIPEDTSVKGKDLEVLINKIIVDSKLDPSKDIGKIMSELKIVCIFNGNEVNKILKELK